MKLRGFKGIQLCAGFFWLSGSLGWCGEPTLFDNLDFELADTRSVTPVPEDLPYLAGFGPTKDLLPSWRLSYGDLESAILGLNFLAPDPGSASLISRKGLAGDPVSGVRGYSHIFPDGFEGDYAMAFSVSDTPYVLSQTGLVPEDTRMLVVDATMRGAVRLETWLNGTRIDDGDISAFAGRTAELEFRLYLERLTDFGHEIGLNRIAFVVPEPSTVCLVSLGLCGLGIWGFASMSIHRKRPSDQSSGMADKGNGVKSIPPFWSNDWSDQNGGALNEFTTRCDVCCGIFHARNPRWAPKGCQFLYGPSRLGSRRNGRQGSHNKTLPNGNVFAKDS